MICPVKGFPIGDKNRDERGRAFMKERR